MHWRETLPDWYVKQYGYQPCVNIGTAGHVDHGKTTLIQALTGQWTSVHSQELKRGITIRVGYSDAAFYKCKKCEVPLGYSTTPKCPNCGKESELSRVVSFVDSPGHESLMANMLSGAALMDGALLLVAANQKVPQPQTKEHLLALQILGIQQIVIIQNKVDLISYQDATANYADIVKFVKGTKAAKSPIPSTRRCPVACPRRRHARCWTSKTATTCPSSVTRKPPLRSRKRCFTSPVAAPSASSARWAWPRRPCSGMWACRPCCHQATCAAATRKRRRVIMIKVRKSRRITVCCSTVWPIH